MRTMILAALAATAALPAMAQDAPAAPDGAPAIVMSTEHPGEEAVVPYVRADANAGATPFADDGLFRAFHGIDGVGRIVDGTLDRSSVDPRTAGIFAAVDMVRLRRTLKEQICYILGGPCVYTGRSMVEVHADIGLQPADFGALVEHMQTAMGVEGVSFRDQNRLLARLAPMKRDIVTR